MAREEIAAQAQPAGMRNPSIRTVRQYAIRLVADLGPLPGAAPSFRGRIGGNTVLEIELDEGLVGLAPGVEPECLALLRDLLTGRPLFPLAAHVRALEARHGGASGKNSASAEIALWDIVGHLLGQPLYRLWGGENGRIEGYASTIGRGASIEERTELAVRIHEEGWRSIKLRPHWETVEDDIRLVRAVREATSETFSILTDANQARGRNLSGISWDLQRALRTAHAFRDLGVGWLEEPLARTDHAGLAALRREAGMPIAGGENNAALADFRDYGVHACLDIWQPEVMLTGPARFLRIAALADAFEVGIVPHEGYQSLGTICQMHLSAALNAPLVEVLHNPPAGDFRHYFTPYDGAPLIGADGIVQLNERPGLGVTLDRSLVEAEY